MLSIQPPIVDPVSDEPAKPASNVIPFPRLERAAQSLRQAYSDFSGPEAELRQARAMLDKSMSGLDRSARRLDAAQAQLSHEAERAWTIAADAERLEKAILLGTVAVLLT